MRAALPFSSMQLAGLARAVALLNAGAYELLCCAAIKQCSDIWAQVNNLNSVSKSQLNSALGFLAQRGVDWRPYLTSEQHAAILFSQQPQDEVRTESGRSTTDVYASLARCAALLLHMDGSQHLISWVRADT